MIKIALSVAVASVLLPGNLPAQEAAPRVVTDTIYLDPAKGADTNSGTKDSPIKTLAAAARRVSQGTGSEAVTVVLAEGVYAVGETAVFKPANRSYTKDKRLTIRAEVLPDDPDWYHGRMPTLIHTMPLSPDWNGRPDPFGGVAYGMLIETSHVTIQGLKILGMPVVEHPKPGAIHRVYPIGRNGRDLEDLEIKQCLFAGDEVTNPNHLGILANGNSIVVVTMKYDKVHRVLGEGNFVLTVSEGMLGGKHSSFYDLFRVEKGKIAEHWDTIEAIPEKKDWKNENGKF